MRRLRCSNSSPLIKSRGGYCLRCRLLWVKSCGKRKSSQRISCKSLGHDCDPTNVAVWIPAVEVVTLCYVYVSFKRDFKLISSPSWLSSSHHLFSFIFSSSCFCFCDYTTCYYYSFSCHPYIE